jgi:hypothetical protein
MSEIGKDATGQPETDGPASLNEVLKAELELLRPNFIQLEAAPYSSLEPAPTSNLRLIYKRIGKLHAEGREPLAALCLSGGGIRSATFNLGVLQALAKHKLLHQFDYLSSVSGGGYIASWLRTWIYRESINPDPGERRDGLERVERKLANLSPDDGSPVECDPLSPEPEPISNLREFSNYLTPQLGFFSGDTWAAAAIVARNLFLNWLVLIPLMAAVVGIPLLFLLVVRVTPSPSMWGESALCAALVIELIASIFIYCFRRFAKESPTSQVFFIGFCVAPVVAAASALSTAALGLQIPWIQPTPDPSGADWYSLWTFSAIWCVGIPLIGWAFAQVAAELHPEWARPRVAGQKKADVKGVADQGGAAGNLPREVPWGWELLGLVVSGAMGMALLVGIIDAWLPYLYAHPVLYVVFVLPILLGIWLGSRALFVGIASLGEAFARSEPAPNKKGAAFESKQKRSTLINSDDSDREWWARLSGWILLVVTTWIALTSVCLVDAYIPKLVGATLATTGADSRWDGIMNIAKWVVGAIGTLSGLIAALTGRSSGTPARTGAPMSGLGKKILAVTGPLFVICLIIMLSWGDSALGKWVTQEPKLFGFYGEQVRLKLNTVDDGWMRFPLALLGWLPSLS